MARRNEVPPCECCGTRIIRENAVYRNLANYGFPTTRKRRLMSGMKDSFYILCDRCMNEIRKQGLNPPWIRSRLGN